jgi:hypothetical protein
LNGVDSAAELKEHPIAHHFHKVAVVLCDEWVDDIAPPRFEGRQRPPVSSSSMSWL